MTSGCPIITTNRGGNKDQVVHGNNGFLCQNLKDFIKYIYILCKNKNLYKAMSENSIRFSKEFSSENIIKKFIGFIEIK